MSTSAYDDIRLRLFNEWWDQFSGPEMYEVASAIERLDEEEALKFIDHLWHEKMRKKWKGFSDQQKREITALLPGQADITDELEKAADEYIEQVAAEADEKKRAAIVGLCGQLQKELLGAGPIIYGAKYDALKEALKGVVESKSRQREPKDNAKQEPRNRFMEQLLDQWLHAGGELGGASSPMVSFFRNAWPEPLLRSRPSNESIVQWAYKNERKSRRVVGGLIRRLRALKDASSQEARGLAASKLQKFERRRRKELAEIFEKADLKNG